MPVDSQYGEMGASTAQASILTLSSLSFCRPDPLSVLAGSSVVLCYHTQALEIMMGRSVLGLNLQICVPPSKNVSLDSTSLASARKCQRLAQVEGLAVPLVDWNRVGPRPTRLVCQFHLPGQRPEH